MIPLLSLGQIVATPGALAAILRQPQWREDSRACTAKPSEPCHEYRHKKAVGVENSTKVLDYVDAEERFNSASFKDGREEQRVVINKNALSTLMENMRSLAKQWRRSIGEHGELVFLHRRVFDFRVSSDGQSVTGESSSFRG
jgi:hypothetical protein